MNKIMMAVVGLALAVALTGCGGSPKGVAEDFADAVIQRRTDKAVAYTAQVALRADSKTMKKLKDQIEKMGKEDINDDKLEAVVYSETISVPSKDASYKIINGSKVTRDEAVVVVQFAKGNDKKSSGMKVEMGKVDGKWKVSDFDYIKDGLDTPEK